MSTPADNQTSISSPDAIVDNSLTWSEAQEKLLKAIAERSNCMRWLHTQCNLYFENFNFYLTIPNIVISTVNGSITMSISSLFPDSQKEATTIVGLVSLLSAILLTINQYVKSQQMAEAHHAAGLSYGKLHRTVMNELALRRDQRTNGMIFLQHVRTEIDRLESTAPSILPYVIRSFNKQFTNRTIERPEVTGDLDEVEVNTSVDPSTSDNNKSSSLESDTTALLPSSTKPIVATSSPSVISTLGSLIHSAKQIFTPPTVSTVQLDLPNVIVDMGVKTDKDDMGYTMAVQESSSKHATLSTTPTDVTLESTKSVNSSSDTN